MSAASTSHVPTVRVVTLMLASVVGPTNISACNVDIHTTAAKVRTLHVTLLFFFLFSFFFFFFFFFFFLQRLAKCKRSMKSRHCVIVLSLCVLKCNLLLDLFLHEDYIVGNKCHVMCFPGGKQTHFQIQ